MKGGRAEGEGEEGKKGGAGEEGRGKEAKGGEKGGAGHSREEDTGEEGRKQKWGGEKRDRDAEVGVTSVTILKFPSWSVTVSLFLVLLSTFMSFTTEIESKTLPSTVCPLTS